MVETYILMSPVCMLQLKSWYIDEPSLHISSKTEKFSHTLQKDVHLNTFSILRKTLKPLLNIRDCQYFRNFVWFLPLRAKYLKWLQHWVLLLNMIRNKDFKGKRFGWSFAVKLISKIYSPILFTYSCFLRKLCSLNIYYLHVAHFMFSFFMFIFLFNVHVVFPVM